MTQPDPRSMLGAVERGNVVWWPVPGPHGETRWQYRTTGPLGRDESRILDQLNLDGLIAVQERHPSRYYYERRAVRLTANGEREFQAQAQPAEGRVA